MSNITECDTSVVPTDCYRADGDYSVAEGPRACAAEAGLDVDALLQVMK